MATFDEEIQMVLNRHPEIGDIEVSYKTKKTFLRPPLPEGGIVTKNGIDITQPALQSASAEINMVAEMLKNGELS